MRCNIVRVRTTYLPGSGMLRCILLCSLSRDYSSQALAHTFFVDSIPSQDYSRHQQNRSRASEPSRNSLSPEDHFLFSLPHFLVKENAADASPCYHCRKRQQTYK